MHRYSMGALVALLGIALAPLAGAAQSAAPRLTDVMSEQERSLTGVATLDAQQRAALESWLARYTATVAAALRTDAAPLARGDKPAGKPAFEDPAAEDPASPDSEEARPRRMPDRLAPLRSADGDGRRMRFLRAVPDAAVVARTIDGGSLVMLRDGSVWEIYLPDRPATVTWERGDAVRVRQRPAPNGEFDYDIYHGPRGGQVAARFAGFAGRR